MPAQGAQRRHAANDTVSAAVLFRRVWDVLQARAPRLRVPAVAVVPWGIPAHRVHRGLGYPCPSPGLPPASHTVIRGKGGRLAETDPRPKRILALACGVHPALTREGANAHDFVFPTLVHLLCMHALDIYIRELRLKMNARSLRLTLPTLPRFLRKEAGRVERYSDDVSLLFLTWSICLAPMICR